MTLAHVEVGRNIRIVVVEISNINTYRDYISEHKYENIPICLQKGENMEEKFAKPAIGAIIEKA